MIGSKELLIEYRETMLDLPRFTQYSSTAERLGNEARQEHAAKVQREKDLLEISNQIKVKYCMNWSISARDVDRLLAWHAQGDKKFFWIAKDGSSVFSSKEKEYGTQKYVVTIKIKNPFK